MSLILNLFKTIPVTERRTTMAIATLCALSLSNTAAAMEFLQSGPSVFNYNYVEIKYLDVDHGDGFALVGSGDIKQNIALQVEYSQYGVHAIDIDTLQFGATHYIQSKSYPEADWVVSAGLERFSGNGLSSESGIFASAGTRYAVNDAIEVNAALQLSTAGDTDLNLHLAALYEVSPGFSAFVETDLGDDSALGLGIRFYWR